jgi:nitronate monooxygenase
VTHLPTLQIGQHIARHPIIQGGMGIRISGANLAAAVANAGGIGIISAVGLGFSSPYFNPDTPNKAERRRQFFEANRLALIDMLKQARALSPTGIIGINSMVAARDHATLVRTAAAQGVNLIIAGAGLPLHLPAYTASFPEVALVPIVSSVRAATLICRKWERQFGRHPDGFVVEDPRTAGGHLGAKPEDLEQPELGLESVVARLVRYLREDLGAPIPVIAAGGVWSHADIRRMLALGASGVQIGTRFITTYECDADPRYKAFHLQAQPEDVVLVESPVGMPGRALRNTFVERVATRSSQPSGDCLNCLQVCKFRDRQETFCILKALNRAAQGDVEQGLVFSGSSAGRVRQLVHVADLMAELTGATLN